MLGVWLAVAGASAVAGALGFRIDNSVGIWFAKDDPALADYRNFLAEFGNREWMLVVLELDRSSHAALAANRARLVSQLGSVPNVRWVVSSQDLPAQSTLVRRFLKPHPESPYEALLLQVTNDIDRTDGYRETLIRDIRSVASAYPTVRNIHIAGSAVINGELNHAARRDMFLFFPAVAVFVALLGGLVFRNMRDTAVLLSVALGTVVVTQGLLIGVGYPLNMITIMLPTVLIALSVADAVHLIHAFHGFRAEHGDDVGAAGRAVRSIAWPCAGTSLTTIAGFLAFAGSSVVPVFQLAVFGAFGIALAWVLTMTVAPLMLIELWHDRERQPPPAVVAGERSLGWWWRMVSVHRGGIMLAFAAGAIALLGLTSLRADTDYVKFFRGNTRVPSDYRVLEREGFPQNPLTLVLQGAGTNLRAPETLGAVRAFAQDLETLPGVHSVLSPFVMSDMTEALGSHSQDLGGMLSRRGDQLQLVAMMDYPSSQELFRLLPNVRRLAAEDLPAEVKVVPTGTSLLWARMDDGVILTQKQSLLVVSVVCFLILSALFRSVWLASLGLALSLYPVGMVLGLMGWWNVPVNLATVLIAGIAVGLAVDDTIHYVHAFQVARRDGVERAAACETALRAVGPRMVMTSLILVGGFAIMGLSDFMPTSQFGLLSSLTIVLALGADIAVLPVVLSWRRRVRQSIDQPNAVAGAAHEQDTALPQRSAWGNLT